MWSFDRMSNDDQSDPWHRWVAFVGSFFGTPYPDPEDDVNELLQWIDDAVAAFAQKIAATDGFQADLAKRVNQ